MLGPLTAPEIPEVPEVPMEEELEEEVVATSAALHFLRIFAARSFVESFFICVDNLTPPQPAVIP